MSQSVNFGRFFVLTVIRRSFLTRSCDWVISLCSLCHEVVLPVSEHDFGSFLSAHSLMKWSFQSQNMTLGRFLVLSLSRGGPSSLRT